MTGYHKQHLEAALTWIEQHLVWWLKNGTLVPDGVVPVAKALSETYAEPNPAHAVAEATLYSLVDVGEVHFDGAGHATISADEFNRLVAAAHENTRWREGLERMAGATHQPTILMAWPFALSREQIVAATYIIDGCMVVAENLLAGRRWNEKEVKLNA